MGFLLKSYDFSLHSSDKTARHRQVFSYRSVSITFLAVAFIISKYGVVAAAVDQTEQQDSDSQSSSTLTCETRILDDVPPDPVSNCCKYISSNGDDVTYNIILTTFASSLAVSVLWRVGGNSHRRKKTQRIYRR